jgi:hypothetical protein
LKSARGIAGGDGDSSSGWPGGPGGEVWGCLGPVPVAGGG